MTMVFPESKRRQTASSVLLIVAGLALVLNTGCLNPAFVNNLSGGSVVPLAPGDTPFVHVLFINATQSFTLDFQYAWTPQFQGFNTAFISQVAPEQQNGALLGCPIDQIGLGDPNDLSAPAIIIRPASGGAINVPPGAFPLVLSRGRDFECGDTVVFTVVDDRTNGYGIQIHPGRVDGRNHTGPFTGPDTFEIAYLLLLSAGTPPIPVP